MADVRVRRKSDHSEIHEMSEYSFELSRDEFELVPPAAGKRPIIEDLTEQESASTDESEKPKAKKKKA